MSLDAFQPQGLTQLIMVTTTPSTPIQTSVAQVGARIYTEGAVSVAFGSSVGSSAIVATLPTTSTPGNAMPLLANSVEVLNMGNYAWVSFVSTGAGPTKVEITAGFGI